MTVMQLPPRFGYIDVQDTGPTPTEQYEVASWQVGGSPKIAFPAIVVDVVGGNRLVRHARPHRPGAKLDSTGAKEDEITIEAKFENSIQEPGMQEINGAAPLYPDVLNKLIQYIKEYAGETGDLVVPMLGPIRAKLDTWRRGNKEGERECETLILTFVEDNEDDVDAASFNLPSVQGNIANMWLNLNDSALSFGTFDMMLDQISDYVYLTEQLLNSPYDQMYEFERVSNLLMDSTDDLTEAFMHPGQEGRDQLADPESASLQQQLVILKDMVGRERAEARRGRPQMVSKVFDSDMSLMAIAASLGQSFEGLLAINSQLENPNHIPAGDVVKVFADA